MGGFEDSDKAYAQTISGKVATLPLLPAVVSQLLVLSPDEDNFLDEVYHLARQDPTFSIRLIQYAAKTCVASGMAEKFSLKYAIARLGSRQIASIVAALSMRESFEPRTTSDRELWIHSVQVAVIARMLIESMPELQIDSELTYLGALLHDIGRFVIFQAVPEGPSRIDEKHWMTPASLLDAELSTCGIDHVTVGIQACERWEIPKAISDIVANHHNYSLPMETVDERLLCRRVCILQIADFYSVQLMHPPAEEPPIDMSVEGEEETEEDLIQQQVEALAEALHGILTQNGQALPEKYRSIMPRILVKRTAQIEQETTTILDALGVFD